MGKYIYNGIDIVISIPQYMLPFDDNDDIQTAIIKTSIKLDEALIFGILNPGQAHPLYTDKHIECFRKLLRYLKKDIPINYYDSNIKNAIDNILIDTRTKTDSLNDAYCISLAINAFIKPRFYRPGTSENFTIYQIYERCLKYIVPMAKGIQRGLDVDIFAHPYYNWLEMLIIYNGMINGIDVEKYVTSNEIRVKIDVEQINHVLKNIKKIDRIWE